MQVEFVSQVEVCGDIEKGFWDVPLREGRDARGQERPREADDGMHCEDKRKRLDGCGERWFLEGIWR